MRRDERILVVVLLIMLAAFTADAVFDLNLFADLSDRPQQMPEESK